MELKEIKDKKIWEKFITKYSPVALFQSWNWGEVLKEIPACRQGRENLWRIGVYDNNKKLVIIAQVMKVYAKRGTFLHVRHGPILSTLNKKYFEFLLDYLKSLGKKEHACFIRISPLLDNSIENQQFFRNFGFCNAPIHAMDGEYCWVLDLDSNEEVILSEMRKTTRYLIRQAQKMGIEIVKSKNVNDIDEFLSLYRETANRHHFVQHRGIKEEFIQFLLDDHILLFKGYFQKRLLSAALIIFYNNQAIYHHSASIEQKIPVNYLLQWEVIKEAKRREMQIYNFWGITPSEKNNHPWRGLSLFKTGFGGRVVEYIHAQDSPLRYSYCATYLYESLIKFWKNY